MCSPAPDPRSLSDAALCTRLDELEWKARANSAETARCLAEVERRGLHSRDGQLSTAAWVARRHGIPQGSGRGAGAHRPRARGDAARRRRARARRDHVRGGCRAGSNPRTGARGIRRRRGRVGRARAFALAPRPSRRARPVEQRRPRRRAGSARAPGVHRGGGRGRHGPNRGRARPRERPVRDLRASRQGRHLGSLTDRGPADAGPAPGRRARRDLSRVARCGRASVARRRAAARGRDDGPRGAPRLAPAAGRRSRMSVRSPPRAPAGSPATRRSPA